jgi:quinolinate synthase
MGFLSMTQTREQSRSAPGPELAGKIKALREKRNAVILAHLYAPPEVQDIADFTGDSLELSIRASKVERDVIVFCGVYFMAETAKILNPQKTVLAPAPDAGCPMSDMAEAEAVRAAKKQFPDRVFVCYVNTSAAVKAECDICCTSSNAKKIVESVDPSREIFFLPDRNLGEWAGEVTGRKIHLWNGYCPTHERISAQLVAETMKKHPGALFAAHPECPSAVRKLAHHLASTSGILKFCRESSNKEFIIGTESGVLHRLRKENPDKIFHEAVPNMLCPNMKKTTLEKILWALEDMRPAVEIDPAVIEKARASLDRMMDVTASAKN